MNAFVRYTSQSTKPLVSTITWTGTGATQNVECPFEPDCIIIFADSKYSTFTHKNMWRKGSAYLSNAQPHIASNGISFASFGFTVGTDTQLNSSGVIYHALILKDNGSNTIFFGSYSGDGIDGHAINSPNSRLIYLMLKRDNVYPAWMRFDKDTTSYPATAAAPANNIKSLTSTGFTVGTAADVNSQVTGPNTGGEAYDYIAFSASEYWDVGNYLGNGSTNTVNLNINSPCAAFIKSQSVATPQLMHAWLNTFSATNSKSVTNSAFVTNGITGSSGRTLTIGTNANVNESNISYNYIVFRSNVSTINNVDNIVARQGFRVDANAGGMIVAAPSSGISSLTGAHTIEVLADINLSALVDQYLFCYNTSVTQFQYSLGWLTALQQFIVHVYDGTDRAYNITGHNRSGINHYIITYDGSTLFKFAVNGKVVKEINSTSLTMTAAPATPALTFGCRASGGVRTQGCINGIFYLSRLYNVALTAEQITNRYNRAALFDTSCEDVDFLEEWDSRNISGSTLYATKSASNNGNLSNVTIV